MAVHTRRIPSTNPVLGRHVRHDDRSWLFAYPTAGLTVQSVVHPRHAPIFDQGQVGSCTGNAGIGALATDPLYGPYSDLLISETLRTPYVLDETGAVALYSDAETLDGDGPYPPQDNGSSGLSIAKVLQAAGAVSGYQHTFSLTDALKALSQTPILIGSDWTDSMFNPDPDGRVRPAGAAVGGHQYVAREVDAEQRRVWCDNSWGPNWGIAGRFYLTFDDLGTLLDREGDVVVLLPATAPAPVPDLATVDAKLADAFRLGGWVSARHIGGNARVARAARTWLDARGL